MGQLIDDLLAFSRIGRAAIQKQNVDLTAMATSVAQDAIAASGRDINLSVAPLPPCFGEPALLNQVFVNLVSNALKFTAKVPDAAITIGCRINGETVYFVRDNGVGFDESTRKNSSACSSDSSAADFEGTASASPTSRVITGHGGRIWPKKDE